MSVLFLGGDMRQRYACEYLREKQIKCEAYLNEYIDKKLIEGLGGFSTIVLPLPVSKDGIYLNDAQNSGVILRSILDAFSPEQLVLGGNIGQDLEKELSDSGYKFLDYNKDEYFQINNALLSAEGAIYFAKERINRAIYGLNIAILGFGRIGKMIAYLLHSQGAKISVYARKHADCTWCEVMGFKVLQIKNNASEPTLPCTMTYDIIFNTIPYQILDESFAKQIDKRTLIMDLASYPYGMNTDMAKKYDLQYYRESGIPGRYAPKSAGIILGKTIINILNRR